MVLFFQVFVFIIGMSCASFAASGGGHSLGIGGILINPSQGDLNKVVAEINESESRSVKEPGTAYELATYYQYRFSSSIFAMQYRATYFSQTASGSGHDIKLNGFTFFPMLRLYPLENAFIKFFLQTGLGYGRLNGSLSGPNGSVDWGGGAFGALGGLGSEFCFTATHCVVVEGVLRYLPIERNIISGTNGTIGGFDTPVNNRELENDNEDVGTTMSGIQGSLIYQMNF